MSVELASYPLWAIFVVSLILVLGSAELGRMAGVRVGARGKGDGSTLEASILGLLALIIGFTFAMALARADARREAVVSEANAIGTTALRARLLPSPHNSEILKLLREYVQIHVDVARKPADREAVSTAINRLNNIQESLWQQAKAVMAKDNAVVPTGLFIQTLNEMIDSQTKRLSAISNNVPNIVLITLYGVAMVATAFSGYARGASSTSGRLSLYVASAIVCIVILQIQDLDRTGRGLITISQQPMIDLAASLATYDQ
jgi:hypothetical protein